MKEKQKKLWKTGYESRNSFQKRKSSNEAVFKGKNIINNFKKKIENKFPEEIVSIVIFSSKARGDAAKNCL